MIFCPFIWQAVLAGVGLVFRDVIVMDLKKQLATSLSNFLGSYVQM